MKTCAPEIFEKNTHRGKFFRLSRTQYTEVTKDFFFFFDDNFLPLVLFAFVSIWYSVWMERIGDTNERKITKHDLFDAFLCLTRVGNVVFFRDSCAPRSPLWRISRALEQCSLVIQISSTMRREKKKRNRSYWQMTDCPWFVIFHAWLSKYYR